MFGDGNGTSCLSFAASVDYTAHELTHAVTEPESNLIYSGESGAINESMSDIFGAFVEAWVDGGKSGVLVTSSDTWTFGENIIAPAIRYLNDPAADGASHDFYSESIGNLDGLGAREEATPVPLAGEVLIRVKASALNFRDLAILLGKSPFPVRSGVVPISDAAGEVEAVGPDVSTRKVGDRVVSRFFPTWYGGPRTPNPDMYGSDRDGWLTEYKVVRAEALSLARWRPRASASSWLSAVASSRARRTTGAPKRCS